MNPNQKIILEMLAVGKISVAEADRLLSLVQSDSPEGQSGQPKKAPKYLRVLITPQENCRDPGSVENVNIRVPMALLRAGIKLASIIPASAYDDVDSALKEKGVKFDLRDIKPENIEEILAAMSELEVKIDDPEKRVRVFTE
jgi:hypothetical protein